MDNYEKSKVGTEQYKKIKCILKQYFKYENFKPHQFEIIDRILQFEDCLAVMPTGYGKSLCFQIPPLVSGELAIIVSPLIALMTDQQLILEGLGINSCCYNSTHTLTAKRKIEADLIAGKYQILYITPESLVNQYALIDKIYSNQGVCMIAIDEAHCISSYGFDFRASYRELNKVRKFLPNVPVLAVTATATDKVIQDIKDTMVMGNCRFIKTSFDRPNLRIHVQLQQRDAMDNISELISKSNGRSIVYCLTKGDTEKMAETLNRDGVSTKAYHAGMQTKDRHDVQKDFMEGKFDCVTATIAFGMGIDCADIRTVVHYGCPQNMESYYQEIGRAGRDGMISDCYLFFKAKDFMIQKRFINEIKDQQYRFIRSKLLQQISGYVNSDKCRRRLILQYFGEQYLEENCGMCDNCLKVVDNKKLTMEDSMIVHQIIQTIQDLNSSFGINMVGLILKGSGSKKLTNFMKKASYYGGMRTMTQKAISDKIHNCIQTGFVESYDCGNCIHVLKPTKKGIDFNAEYSKKIKKLNRDYLEEFC